ncbi:MAG: glycosyltransferase [Nakamurella sp.]
MRVVTDDDESKVAAASADYDLFVTATYMSKVLPQSKRSAYVCFFPTPPDHEMSDRQRTIAKKIGGRIRPAAQIRGFGYGTGWFPPEGGLRQQWSWSNGNGILELPHGGDETFRVLLGRPGIDQPAQARIVDQDGTLLARLVVDRAFRQIELKVPASTESRTLHLLSDTVKPTGDSRELGIAIGRDRLTTRMTPPRLLARQFPWLLTPHSQDLSFLSAYDTIVTISNYTQTWVHRLWHKESELLFPPIDVAKMQPSPDRDKTIITIGRFFDPVRGHSKRQLEMVEIFRQLMGEPGMDGWSLHMIGGCEESNRAYFEKVMAAAEGLPIELHPNAQRHVLERLISRASIFWSATGMNEDTDRRPWRNEHFGMTTAEAMAAGCVPVVIDRAGQREIVRDSVDGYRWETATQAVRRTAEVANDPGLGDRLSASSIAHAADFSDEAFSARWREICVEAGLNFSPQREDTR